jgi:ADP-heptose:LPS heptosyltransferase
MQKLILSNFQAPGDIVMLTAAIRDLHISYPKQFVTDVRTACPQLWENNPYITRLDDKEITTKKILCHYPLIHKSNELPYHFIHGFSDYLNKKLNLQIRPAAFKGDIHLSKEEEQGKSQVHEIAGIDIPFWIVVSGGKTDFTAKWWSSERYQSVVDHFRGRICFVQIGEKGHHHPPLNGVIDLRGKTNLRELVKLVYHAQGVITPVSLPMHLAAAVKTKAGAAKQRACVVVAGGREPVHWEEYPGHQFIHTIGALSCCETGGCWKSRVKPLYDGSGNDRPQSLCVDVVNNLPRCLDMITPEEVIKRVEWYFNNKNVHFIDSQDFKSVQEIIFKVQ